MKTNLQIIIEKNRALYEVEGAPPLLQQIVKLHTLTIREFADIFDISKDYAEKLMKHRVFPTVPLAFDIARYFEVTVEDLWGWRVDDHGKRRPLLIEDPKTGKAFRLLDKPAHATMELVRDKMKADLLATIEKETYEKWDILVALMALATTQEGFEEQKWVDLDRAMRREEERLRRLVTLVLED